MFTISLQEVIRGIRRKNHEENLVTHFFGARVSFFFSYIFINLGWTPNQVTFLFFLTGLVGAVCAFCANPLFAVFTYILFRLHIVFDICDGEVARFTKKTSLNGAYWDYMIHCTLYPMYVAGISVGGYYAIGEIRLLLISPLVVFVAFFSQVVKNNFYRALAVNRVSIDMAFPKKEIRAVGNRLIGILKRVGKNSVNFEGLMFGFLVLTLSGYKGGLFYLLILYAGLNFSTSLIKFYQFTKKGFVL